VSCAVFLAAPQTIRRVLVDHAREKVAQKREGNRHRVMLTNVDPAVEEPLIDLLDLNQAMEKLDRENLRVFQVLVCHYIAGMIMGEIAKALGMGLWTVEDDWAFAKVLAATGAWVTLQNREADHWSGDRNQHACLQET
jgi:RNA polymerase sigma-70 factor (ECF subfamily)